MNDPKIIRIEHGKDPFEIPVKRFYLPIKIYWKCPKGHENITDLNRECLSYPLLNVPNEYGLCCSICDDEDDGPPFHFDDYNFDIEYTIDIDFKIRVKKK